MSVYYLDASVWVKRHVEEAGSDWVSRFWGQQPSLVCSTIGWLEVLSAIVRRSKADDPRLTAIRTEIIADREGMYEISVSSQVAAEAEELIQRHRLRCADAIHLASAIRAGQEMGGPVCVVASDAELLAAAAAEGLLTLDPQSNPPLPESDSAGR